MNLPDDHISAELVVPVIEARAFIDGSQEGNFIEELDNAIDLAQGSARSEAHAKYVVIRVVP